MSEVTKMLEDYRNGNREVLDELLPLVYGELRRLAHSYLRSERQDLTLQTTALVHEAYLKLIDQHSVSFENRAQFFALSATAMRRILLDNARRHSAEKRGSGGAKVSLDEVAEISVDVNEDLIALDLALQELVEQKKDFAAASELYRKVLPIDSKNAEDEPNNVTSQMDLSFSYGSIATVSMNLENFDAALENFRRKLAIQEKVAAADAKNSFAQTSLARTYQQLGDVQQKFERFDEAAAEYQKSIEMFEKLSAADPNNVSLKARLAEIYSAFGNFLLNLSSKSATNKLARLREAQTFQKRGLEIFQTLKSQNKLDEAYEFQFGEVQKGLQQTENELAKLTR